MAKENGVEWIIKIGVESSEILELDNEPVLRRIKTSLNVLFINFMIMVLRFFKKVWDIGIDNPRKLFHCLKVGVALILVSLFYYVRPLYDSFGGNALWALMTVVVVFEYTVGRYPNPSKHTIFYFRYVSLINKDETHKMNTTNKEKNLKSVLIFTFRFEVWFYVNNTLTLM